MLQSASEMQWMLEDDERRIKDRFAAPCLKVEVRRRGWLGWQGEPVRVSCLDINRYGAAILSPLPLQQGTKLNLKFEGKYITQSDVQAEVVSTSPFRTGFRLGLQFCYCTKRALYSRAIDNALSRIEALYRKSRRH